MKIERISENWKKKWKLIGKVKMEGENENWNEEKTKCDKWCKELRIT